MKTVERKEFLAGLARAGALAGIAGACVALGSREEASGCRRRCGECPKFAAGRCGLGRE